LGKPAWLLRVPLVPAVSSAIAVSLNWKRNSTASATAGHVLLEIALEQASDETEEDDAAIP
jgi:hypothetical protein